MSSKLPTAGSGITYNGLAKISYLNGKKVVKQQVIKNHGTELLFKLLTQCICGVVVSSSMPKYLDIGHISEQDSEYLSNLAVRVNTTSRFITNITLKGDKSTYAAQFTALVPPGIVLSDRSSIPATRLRLYNDYYGTDDLSLLAEIELPDESPIEFSANTGYTLMIEWYMYFTNNDGEQLSAVTTTTPTVGA